MAQFDECIRSAQKQGVLSEEEADALIARYAEHRSARAAAGETDPDGAAKSALAGEFEAAAAIKRAMADGSERARNEIASYLQTYRTRDGAPDVFEAAVNLIENYGAGAGTSSMAGRSHAIVALAHGELADLLTAFRRSRLTGRRFNKPQADNVVREVLGSPTGSAEAQGMGQAVTKTIETLRTEFNRAAGYDAIPKLDGPYLPQLHEPRALLSAGFERWREAILPRLDLERMRDPLTGGRLTPERLDDSLRVSFDRITTNGWSDREPVARPFGLGAVAGQRSDHRFLHFKSPDDWLAYNREFGTGDPLKAIFQHINSMARDIAAMDIFGPNPSATVAWLKQVVQSEAAKAVKGEESLYGKAGTATKLADKLNYLPWRIQAVFDYVRGREVVSNRWATGFGNVRNVLTSAQLGGTSILAAVTDPFIDMSTRYLSGLPATKALWGLLSAIKSGTTREQAVRSGIILDDFLHIMGDEARYAGTLGGSEWSKWLADRTVNLNGLEPMTQARRHVFALDFQAAVADNLGSGFDQLPAYLRRTFADYGLGAKEWAVMQKVAPHQPDGGAGFLQPIDVAKRSRNIAERYLEMILGQTERSVPTGTARARSFVTGSAPRGSLMGEILESGLQYKSFTLSFTTLQWQALMGELHQGIPRGAAYGAALAVGVTMGGAMAVQLRNMIAGKDLQPMDASTGQGLKFWLQALQTGGGFGIMGDFLFADQTRFGHSLGETLAGPTVGLMSDVFKITTANAQKALTGKKTNVARDTINFAGRYTPALSTLPYTRMAYRRMFLDQLQYLTDPDAHKQFREQESRLRRETGQGFFWPPGEMQPQRAPEFSSATK